MYGCESWTIKKAEHWIIDAFEPWCWRRLLRVLWTARRYNQFILKEISTEYSLEGLMLRLKLQYFGHLMWRTDSLEQILMLGKTEGRKRREKQRTRWLKIRSVAQLCPTLCDPMDHTTPGFLVFHYVSELVQTHVHWVSDAIQPSHPVVTFSSCLKSFPATGYFLRSQFFASGGQSIGASASASVLSMNI